MSRVAALGVLVLLLVGCATPATQRVPAAMRCDAEVRDPIDCKVMEFTCRNAGRLWNAVALECVAP